MKFSVLLCVYYKDNYHWFKNTLISLFEQTKKADEIVIVIDGKVNNDLEKIIKIFKKKLPLKIYRNTTNKGLAYSLNKGLLACSNELVARIDSDDIALRDRFEKQLEHMLKNPKTIVLGGSILIIDSKDKIIGKRSYPTTYESIFKGMWKNTLAHGTVIFRKSIILKEGMYNEKLRRGQDYELWFRLLNRGYKIENLEETIGCWRFEPNDFFKSTFNQKFQQAIIGFRGTRALKLPLWKQLICFAPLIPYFFPRFLSGIYTNLKNIIHK